MPSVFKKAQFYTEISLSFSRQADMAS